MSKAEMPEGGYLRPGAVPIEDIEAGRASSLQLGGRHVEGDVGHLAALQGDGKGGLQHVGHRLPNLTKAADDHRPHILGVLGLPSRRRQISCSAQSF